MIPDRKQIQRVEPSGQVTGGAERRPRLHRCRHSAAGQVLSCQALLVTETVMVHFDLAYPASGGARRSARDGARTL